MNIMTALKRIKQKEDLSSTSEQNKITQTGQKQEDNLLITLGFHIVPRP